MKDRFEILSDVICTFCDAANTRELTPKEALAYSNALDAYRLWSKAIELQIQKEMYDDYGEQDEGESPTES